MLLQDAFAKRQETPRDFDEAFRFLRKSMFGGRVHPLRPKSRFVVRRVGGNGQYGDGIGSRKCGLQQHYIEKADRGRKTKVHW